MPRTNLEDEALPRVTKLSEIMACTYREALGTVMSLWRESQTVLSVEGSKDDIIDWAWLHSLETKEQDRWIKGLIRARFLTQTEDGYKIRGNQTQIENRVSKLTSAHKGGEATKNKWQKIKDKLATRGHRKADSYPKASNQHAETTQSLGTRQDKTDQDRPDQTISIQTKPMQERETAETEEAVTFTEGRVSLSVSGSLLLFLRNGKISPSTAKTWLAEYPDGAWVKAELLKALAYFEENPAKRPSRDLTNKLNAWLAKGWEWKRKDSHPPGKSLRERLVEIDAADAAKEGATA